MDALCLLTPTTLLTYVDSFADLRQQICRPTSAKSEKPIKPSLTGLHRKPSTQVFTANLRRTSSLQVATANLHREYLYISRLRLYLQQSAAPIRISFDNQRIFVSKK